MPSTVFVDSNVLKFAATHLPRFVPKKEEIQWGPRIVEVVVHHEVVVNPNDNIANPILKAEADLLPQAAAFGKSGVVEFVRTVEALYEEWGLPDMDSETGTFYGAPIRLINAPFKYGRVMGRLGIDGKAEQYRFLTSIKSPRFDAIQRATGAFQGAQPLDRNQLIDAFHIWCAEAAGCAYFLTLDFKLQRTVSQSKLETPLLLLRPSEFIGALASA